MANSNLISSSGLISSSEPISGGQAVAAGQPYYFEITISDALTPNGNGNLLFDFGQIRSQLSTTDADQFWNNVKADGGDLRIYFDDTRRALDLRDFDAASEGGVMGFDATGHAASGSTVWRIEFGDSNLSQPLPTEQYGSNEVYKNGFVGVYPLDGDAAAGWADASGVNGDGTTRNIRGSDVKQAGQIGESVYLTTVSYQTYGDITIPKNITASEGTISGLIKIPSGGSDPAVVFGFRNPGTGYFELDPSGILRWSVKATASNSSRYTLEASITGFSFDTWHHISVTVEAGQQPKLYFDGSLQTNVSAVNTEGAQDRFLDDLMGQGVWAIGSNYGGSTSYTHESNAYFDEVRFSSVPRSAAYIEEEYNNQFNQSGFWSVGAVQESGSTVVVHESTPQELYAVPSIEPSIAAITAQTDAEDLDIATNIGEASGSISVIASTTEIQTGIAIDAVTGYLNVSSDAVPLSISSSIEGLSAVRAVSSSSEALFVQSAVDSLVGSIGIESTASDASISITIDKLSAALGVAAIASDLTAATSIDAIASDVTAIVSGEVQDLVLQSLISATAASIGANAVAGKISLPISIDTLQGNAAKDSITIDLRVAPLVRVITTDVQGVVNGRLAKAIVPVGYETINAAISKGAALNSLTANIQLVNINGNTIKGVSANELFVETSLQGITTDVQGLVNGRLSKVIAPVEVESINASISKGASLNEMLTATYLQSITTDVQGLVSGSLAEMQAGISVDEISALIGKVSVAGRSQSGTEISALTVAISANAILNELQSETAIEPLTYDVAGLVFGSLQEVDVSSIVQPSTGLISVGALPDELDADTTLGEVRGGIGISENLQEVYAPTEVGLAQGIIGASTLPKELLSETFIEELSVMLGSLIEAAPVDIGLQTDIDWLDATLGYMGNPSRLESKYNAISFNPSLNVNGLANDLYSQILISAISNETLGEATNLYVRAYQPYKIYLEAKPKLNINLKTA